MKFAGKRVATDDWPRGTARPAPTDTVQVVMSEEMARRFEARCLGIGNTRGRTRLSPPLRFRVDDLPTYIVVVDDPSNPTKE